MIGPRKDRGFFGFEPELEAEIFDFQRSEYPQRKGETAEAHWRWMFLSSAARLGVAPQVWLYRKDNAVVAHQGAIPVRLKAGDEEVLTGWFVETMAARKVRGSPIGPMLIKKALEDLPLNLSLGQTDLMRELQFKLGWKAVRALSKYLFVTGHRMNLRNKLPPGLAEAVATALRLRCAWRLNRLRAKQNPELRFSFVERFGEVHDELWSQMAATCRCAVIRDSSYLNWKYVDRPNSTFKRIEMCEGGKVSGVVVVKLACANRVYPYKRGYIVDFVVALNRPDLIAALVSQAVRILKSEGVETVTCQVASRELCAVLERAGFIRREPRHQFLVAVAEGDDRASLLLEGDNWLLTLGDSDADAFPD